MGFSLQNFSLLNFLIGILVSSFFIIGIYIVFLIPNSILNGNSIDADLITYALCIIFIFGLILGFYEKDS